MDTASLLHIKSSSVGPQCCSPASGKKKAYHSNIYVKAFFFLIVLIVFSLWKSPIVVAGLPVFKVNNRVVTVTTDRYEVDWENGSMVRIVTLLPKRQVFALPSGDLKKRNLPLGLGSFYRSQAAARSQHGPLFGRSIPCSFDAQHQAVPSSILTWEFIPNGIHLKYQGLKGDPGAVLIQELIVEDESGDLVIRQHGNSSQPGVFGISFSVENLNPDLFTVIPFFSGERWDGEIGKGKVQTFAWPKFWSAALLIIEDPTGNASFSFWAQDRRMRPKYLHAYNDGAHRGFAFESCEDAPYDARLEAESCEWRFNTFGGSWVAPAKRYKKWLKEAFKIKSRENKSAQWVNDVSLVWPSSLDTNQMKEMSRRISPRNVLIQHWGVLKGFNRRIPEYTPQDKFLPGKVLFAHRYGYHVGAYSSMLLIDAETYPDIMTKYDLDYMYDGLTEDKPSEPESWLAAVHPGSLKWREFYANRMSELQHDTGLDLLYQDMSGAGFGSAGAIEGNSFSAAVVACQDEIQKREPQIGLMGEYWNEVNACREDFAINNYLSWFDNRYKERLVMEGTIHPVLSLLFSDFCVRTAFSKPYRQKNRFHLEERINEVTGSIPYWNTSVHDTSGEAQLTLERANILSRGFRPHFPDQWEENVVAYLKNDTGDIIKYILCGQNIYCYLNSASPENLIYARLTGLRKVESDSPVHIVPWIAYSTNGPIGMDPTQWYCLFPGHGSSSSPINLTRLPTEASINQVRQSDAFVLIGIDGKYPGTIEWENNERFRNVIYDGKIYDSVIGALDVSLPTTLLFTRIRAPESITPHGEPEDKRYDSPATGDISTLKIEAMTCNVVSNGWFTEAGKRNCAPVTVGNGLTVNGCTVRPPVGGKNAEITFDHIIKVPDVRNPAMRVYAGRRYDCPSDGSTLVVRVNGMPIWRRVLEEPGINMVSVPLKKWHGKEVLLSIGVDCGNAGDSTSCDETFLGDLKIVSYN